MIEDFLKGSYETLHLVHVPMSFSRSTSEIGAFGIRKLFHLGSVLGSIWKARFKNSGTVLYYPPAGANLNPVLRDMVLLLASRWLFRYTVFHFHAAGLKNIFPKLSRLLQPLFMFAYGTPDLAIFPTRATSGEASFLKARVTAIIPCGAPDCAPPSLTTKPSERSGVLTILFAGILCEEKGVLVLLEACRILRDAGQSCNIVCLGTFQTSEFKQRVENFLHQHELTSKVSFPGVLTGIEKHLAFLTADIFCFPSYYPAESFGVVLIEAMSYSLPIVASDWQGIPEVTGQSEGSLLVPVRDPDALASSLATLISSPRLRNSLGIRNRIRYLTYFTQEKYRANLEEHLKPFLDA